MFDSVVKLFWSLDVKDIAVLLFFRKMMELGTRIKFSQCSLKVTKCFPADSREKIRLQSCLMCIDGLQAFAFSQSAVFSTGVGQPNEVRQTGS